MAVAGARQWLELDSTMQPPAAKESTPQVSSKKGAGAEIMVGAGAENK